MDEHRKAAINARKRENYHHRQAERSAQKNNPIVNTPGKKN